MPSQYVVVQFGDLFRGEFLNLGIFAWDTDENVMEVKSKFLTNLTRIKITFGCNDPFLNSVMDNWVKKINTKVALWDLVARCESPYASFQITPTRGSLLPVDQLLEETAQSLLVE